MPTFSCSACHQKFFDPANLERPCMFCGYNPKTGEAPYERGQYQPDFRRLARSQRIVVRSAVAMVVLASATTACLWFSVIPLIPLVMLIVFWITLHLTLFAFAIRILAVHSFTGASGLHSVMLLLPGLNLVSAAFALARARSVLREGGIRAGWLGVSDQEVARWMNPNACRGCGYNLQGNQSGRCPECGRYIDPSEFG